MNRIVPLAFAAIGVFAFAGAACAAPEFAVQPGFTTDANARIHETKVGFTDIDLSSDSGAQVALARIDRAATAVCGGAPDKRDTDSERADFATCHADAMRNAASEVGAPVLTALVKRQPATLMARN